MKSSHRIDTPAAGEKDGTLYVAFELSKSKWLIGMVLSGESKMSRHVVAGGDTAAVWQLISKKRAQAEKKLGRPVRVVSCYEAGFDGFWLDRWLAEQGIENRVLDPSSIEMPRRARQAKTDRLDLERLMRVLIRHEGGEPRVCSVVRPPSPEQEDARRLSRERERLIGERTAHGNRIKGLLHGQGVREWSRGARTSRAAGGGAHRRRPRPAAPAGGRDRARACPPAADRRAACRGREPDEGGARGRRPGQPGAAGQSDTRPEGLRPGRRRDAGQRGVLARLPQPAPGRRRTSGWSARRSTAARARASRASASRAIGRARTLAIELAWLWLRHQPDSALSRWFKERVGDQKGRIRRIAIVALARKLMVALWRFLTHGVVPENAIVRAAAPAGR